MRRNVVKQRTKYEEVIGIAHSFFGHHMLCLLVCQQIVCLSKI